MRTIINYIRSCFCKHEWEYLGDVAKWPHHSEHAKAPYAYIKCWRCNKCGYVMKTKLE